MKHIRVILCLAVMSSWSTAAAQVPLHRVPGSAPFERFGSAVMEVGDVNGDGLPDFLASTQNGRVDLVDGSLGQVLLSFAGAANEDFGHALAAPGDVDGDQIPDIAIAAPAFSNPALPGRVEIFSGATGLSLLVMSGVAPKDHFGFSLFAMDVTGDGIKDFVIGAPGRDLGNTNAGEVTIHDGLTGVVLANRLGTQIGENLGHAVSGIRDIDGDRVRDVLVGAPGGNQPPMGTFYGGTGEVQLLSGSTLAPLLLLQGVDPEDAFGTAVVSCSDIDGDGLFEIVVGSPGVDDGLGSDVGTVTVWSSATGKLLRMFHGLEAGERYGDILVNLNNVDGQGGSDVAICLPLSGESTGGRVDVLDIQTGRLVWQLRGTGTFENVGSAAAASRGYGDDRPGEFHVGVTGSHAGGLFSGEVRSFSFGHGLYGPVPRGAVGASGGTPAALLRVNGSKGDRVHRVRVPVGQPFLLGMRQPPGRLSPAPFVIYGTLGEVALTDSVALPGGPGTMCFTPCDLAPWLQPKLFVLAATSNASTCPSLISATPTPWNVWIPGIPEAQFWTIQGIVEELPGTLRVTNALLLDIR